MFRYVAWADQKALEALRAAPGALPESLPLLAHLLSAEHVWLARLEQREPRYPVWPALGLDECDLLAAENEAGYRAFVERLGEDQLAGSVRYRTSQGQEFVTHGPYHRGQIA